MIEYRLDHVMPYTAKLTGPEMIGEVPDGIRAIIYFTDGEMFVPPCKPTMADSSMTVSSLAQSSTLPGHRSGILDRRAAGCEKVLAEQVPSGAELRNLNWPSIMCAKVTPLQ